MAETSHRNNPDWKDLADQVPLDAIDPEFRTPTSAPEDLPGSRSEMLPREESEAVARMADAVPAPPPQSAAPRAVKPDETSFFGFPHPAPVPGTEPTLFDDSRSAPAEGGVQSPDASQPESAAWEEDEAAVQERLRKWMAEARMRSQTPEASQDPARKEPSPSLQRLTELQRTMIMDSGAGSEPTLAETPEAHAKSEAARLRAAQPPTPVDPMATIMVPADQFLGGKLSGPSDFARNPPRTVPERAAASPRPLTREEALTRKIALLRKNAEGLEDGPAWTPPAPSDDKSLIVVAIALIAVICALGFGLFAATQAGMFDGLESRFEFLRPNVSADLVSAGTASAGTAPTGTASAGAADSRSPADMGDPLLGASLVAAAKADAPNLLSLYGRFARSFPGLTGEVRMRLTVDSKGRIMAGSVTSSTTGVADFDKAVLLRVRGWRLRESPGSAPRIVSFPLLFPLRGL